MNFYEANVKYEQADLPFSDSGRSLFPGEDVTNERRWRQDTFASINDDWGAKCDPKNRFSIFVWEAKRGELGIIFVTDGDEASYNGVSEFINKYLTDNYDVCNIVISNIKEITSKRFHLLGDRGDNNGIIKRFRGDEYELRISYRENTQYKLVEEIIEDEVITYDEAVELAKKIMADATLFDELERIYSDDNEKKYYGNPVHYKVSASNTDAAYEIIKLLTRALISNNRLCGRRINRILDIKEGCYDEDDFDNLVEASHGNVLMIDGAGTRGDHGNYASSYEDVINYYDRLIKGNHVKTLFVFMENTECPGFADLLVTRAAENIDVIDIKEGSGDRETAIEYIVNIANEKGQNIDRQDVEAILTDKKEFSVADVYEIYNNWFRNGLKNTIYKSYKNCSYIELKTEKQESKPYETLKKMIGLSEVKDTVDEILDSARIQKIRSDMGMNTYKTSLHMVFTGNPGSAKTTVARLMSQIYLKEGILGTGKYVECGRADLVGKYVGWTAKTVRSKFSAARGGVLFIDEAYSLVDDSNTFGDEAINTIVQEMENHRDNVVVIFAGYPDKMKTFLDKNEGLRSRIAFHLDFPDYNARELVDILKLMAEEKGYKLDDIIEQKCLNIFEDACKQEDFGNGRFARNLLEQAMMAQARRLSREYKGRKISRKALCTLKAEDFDVNASKNATKEKHKAIGFAV